MLYTKNLITQAKQVESYNTAVRQINALDIQNKKYLEDLYKTRESSYKTLQNSKLQLENQLAALKKMVGCVRDLSRSI